MLPFSYLKAAAYCRAAQDNLLRRALAEAHENGRCLCAGGATARHEAAVVSLNEGRAAGPPHGGNGVCADGGGVLVAC